MGKAKRARTAAPQPQEVNRALEQDIHDQAAEIAEEIAAHLAGIRSPADLLAERFGLLQPPDLSPRFNIAPSQLVPVIGTKAGGHARGLAMFKWGFIPHWANDDKGMKPVNARAETVATKPMFADSFRLRRCIVLADSFYEWKTVNKKKMPVHFRLKTGAPFGFAGVWDVWNGPTGKVFSAAIITTEPNELTREVHNRGR
jgi:putative SOS response-associated peptidase YedK